MTGPNWLRNGICLLLFLCGVFPARGDVRIKDITTFQGARSNQLLGIGLVDGLNNTGGKTPATQKMAVDMLSRFQIGTTINGLKPGDSVFKSNSVSMVTVTAELGPFDRAGSRIDVIVSVLDDASSLQNGTLLSTPLRGADGVVYAVAQGPVDVGGFLFSSGGQGSGPALASVQKNHPTVGRMPGGANVEREARGEILCKGQLRLLLRHPDYITSRNITKAINTKFPDSAISVDAGTVQILVPPEFQPTVINFAAEIGLLEVNVDLVAKVVLNSRTGTIVAGQNVKIAMVAVAHGNLAIVTNTQLTPSQPSPFSNKGKTVVVPDTKINVLELGGPLKVLPQTTTVAELALAMKALGASPQDMIAIFQALKEAGALHAELVIM